MNVSLRLRLLALGCAAAAVCLGWWVATGEYGLPMLVAVFAIGGILMRLFRAPLDAIALGLVLFGYLVGNRGFAQLMPDPRLPLLPAEAALLVAGGWLVVQSAFARRLPFRPDALNWIILAWLTAGTIRVVFDVRPFGWIAIRDYAMIYYAAFFFIAQQLGAAERSQRFLLGALIAASLVQPVAFVLEETFPEFFLQYLVVRGVPLIYFKGDLALTFMAVSALLLALGLDARHRRWTWPVALIELVLVLGGENRASVLGALVALAWLAFSRVRRFVALQSIGLAAALLVVAGLALLADNSWAGRKFDGFTDRVVSMADVFGTGSYGSAESGMKGDNNRFRTVWWRNVVDETLARNSAFGCGFGYDLARTFLEEYSPDIADDFTARSPHSIVVTTFGRMGFTGLGVFALLCGVLARKTWRAMRNPAAAPAQLALWAAIWAILVSACFGVVLEGPMGAVVFWSLLGLANAMSAEVPVAGSQDKTTVTTSAADLQNPATVDEVAAPS